MYILHRFRSCPGILSILLTLYSFTSVAKSDSLAQWLEHAIADRRVPCSNHGWVLCFAFSFIIYLSLCVSGSGQE